MPTGYTSDELALFTNMLTEKAPPFPAAEDIATNPAVAAITTAGAEVGLLLNANTDRGVVKLTLNPVVAAQLVRHILHAAEIGGWWDENMNMQAKLHS